MHFTLKDNDIGLISYITEKGEGLALPGKIYAGSPGTLLLTEEEKALAIKQEKTDVIMSIKAIDSVWDGMTGEKEVPAYMKYLQLGDYTGLRDVYLSFGGDEVFLAGAQSIKKRLEKFGAHVTMEIGEGMYHSYAMLPLVKDAEDATSILRNIFQNKKSPDPRTIVSDPGNMKGGTMSDLFFSAGLTYNRFIGVSNI